MIQITLVDYDSNVKLVSKYKQLCEKYNAQLIRVDNQLVWCKSHALNIAIKQTTTKYILSSDVDIIFEKNYIHESIKLLKKNVFQVILADMLDLPPLEINNLDFENLKPLSKSRYKGSGYVIAIPLALTYFFKKIRGYDEQYKLWGKEDDDLIKRFYMLGVDKKLIQSSYHLHQWHSKYEGVKNLDFKKQLNWNTEYFNNTHSLVRNNKNWGTLQ